MAYFSSSQAFLEAVDPQVAVISVGADNRFGHPAPQVLGCYAEQGVPVLRTDELGTLEFVTEVRGCGCRRGSKSSSVG